MTIDWRRIRYSVLTLFATLCFPFGMVPAEDSVVDQMRVITYNVQFLPEPASVRNERPNPEYRADQIAKQVKPL